MIIEAMFYEQYERDFELCNQPDQGAREARACDIINSIKSLDEFVSPNRHNADKIKAQAIYKLCTALLKFASEELWDISIELDDTIPYMAIRLVLSGLIVDRTIDNDLRQIVLNFVSSADFIELDAVGNDLVCLATFKLFSEETVYSNDDIKV